MKNLLEQAGYVLNPQSGIWASPDFTGIAYSDGDDVEQRLARLIAATEDRSVLSDELKQHITDWPSLYHLSSSRANILRPFEQRLSGAQVLEIGAGCGAITRYLGECGACLLALEGSMRRAGIARARVRDLSNVEVLAERFDQFSLGTQFDVITLIGVLEYANLFMSGENPALTMLQRARALLKPGGVLLIAIENQLGLKYWAGASEDHLGMPMYGLEGRYRADQPKTYGRKILNELIVEAGFVYAEFLSALPDYKLPISIITSGAFDCADFDSGAFASQCVHSDPQLPPDLNFSPEFVWPVVEQNGLALDLANSFLISANTVNTSSLNPDILTYHYSVQRRKSYCKETIFQRDADGVIRLRYRSLSGVNKGVKNGILRFDIQDHAEYINGTPMATELLELVARDGWSIGEVGAFLRRYLEVLGALELNGGNFPALESVHTKLPGIYFDLTPQNLMRDRQGDYHAIDCEWSAINGIPVGWLMYRALLSLSQTLTRFGSSPDSENLTRADFFIAAMGCAGFSVTRSELESFARMEGKVQAEVTGRPSEELFNWKSDAPLLIKKKCMNKVEVNAVTEEINKIISKCDAAVKTVAAMQASWSWRLTAPIRWAGHLARGNFVVVPGFMNHIFHHLGRRLPKPLTSHIRSIWDRGLSLTSIRPNSSANFSAIAALVNERCELTRTQLLSDPLCAQIPHHWPPIDISVVTYNSQQWVAEFIKSLLATDYPKDRVSVQFIDNSSTDGTETALRAAALRLRAAGFSVDVLQRPNLGFGAGHNAALRRGHAPFCLVTNIDLTFEPGSLRQVVAMAMADVPKAVAWEFRQKPYEHPKFYDPITGTTNWNAHACVLLRRSAMEAVNGYDETLFMYGEDVELSYRLRQAGYLLRYCPAATVWHYSYEFSNQIKPLQYTGSTFANLYVRLKYGKLLDAAVVPLMAMRLLVAPEVFEGSRRQVASSFLKLLTCVPKALMYRHTTSVHFPFRTWDYDLIRDGAFVELHPLPAEQPLVSIVTRTYLSRDLYLRQALLSAAHQTWSNIEIIVVEDGGGTMRSLCEEIAGVTGRKIHFIANGKYGRSRAGNTGLAAARGRWCLFLDDDDLLFSDHVEVLANKLLSEPDAVASYTLSWEVVTDTSGFADGHYAEITHRLPPLLAQDFDFNALCHHNCFPIQSVLFERQLFVQRGGFDEDMDALEDWVLWIRYARGNRFAHVPKLTSMFRTPYDPAKVKERNMAFKLAYPLALARSEARIGEYQYQHDSK